MPKLIFRIPGNFWTMLQMREISSTDFAVNIDEKSTGRRLLCRGDRGEIVSFAYLMMKNDVVSSFAYSITALTDPI